jgi:ABC transporter
MAWRPATPGPCAARPLSASQVDPPGLDIGEYVHGRRAGKPGRQSCRAVAGEVLGFLGPNGAGRSTTIRLLLGLARPTAGRAWIFDDDAADVAMAHRTWHMVAGRRGPTAFRGRVVPGRRGSGPRLRTARRGRARGGTGRRGLSPPGHRREHGSAGLGLAAVAVRSSRPRTVERAGPDRSNGDDGDRRRARIPGPGGIPTPGPAWVSPVRVS